MTAHTPAAHDGFDQRIMEELNEIGRIKRGLDLMRCDLDEIIERRRDARLRFCLALGETSEIIVSCPARAGCALTLH